MKPLDFYQLGVDIASSASTEAQYRTAISRIYYGLHHECCCRYFRKLSFAEPLNGNRRHTDLRDRFNTPRDPISNKISQLLGNLMMARTEADYQLAPPIIYGRRSYSPEDLMRLALDRGQELLEALEDYSPGEADDGCDCPTVYSSR